MDYMIDDNMIALASCTSLRYCSSLEKRLRPGICQEAMGTSATPASAPKFSLDLRRFSAFNELVPEPGCSILDARCSSNCTFLLRALMFWLSSFFILGK